MNINKPELNPARVHCNKCNLLIGQVVKGGSLLLTNGLTLRYPVTLKCTCGLNIRLGRGFQGFRDYPGTGAIDTNEQPG